MTDQQREQCVCSCYPGGFTPDSYEGPQADAIAAEQEDEPL